MRRHITAVRSIVCIKYYPNPLLVNIDERDCVLVIPFLLRKVWLLLDSNILIPTSSPLHSCG